MKTLVQAWLVATVCLCGSPRVALAEIIVEQQAFDTTSNKIPGQSLTTPAGGPWTNLTFNWFDEGGNPVADGDLFMLDREYLGPPDLLTIETPGVIAMLVPNKLGFEYVVNPTPSSGGNPPEDFEPVRGNAPVFIYSKYRPSAPLRMSGDDVYVGGHAYEEPPGEFVPLPGSDWAFRLQGEVIPEPSSLALAVWALLGLSGLTYRAYHRRRRTTIERAANRPNRWSNSTTHDESQKLNWS